MLRTTLRPTIVKMIVFAATGRLNSMAIKRTSFMNILIPDICITGITLKLTLFLL